MEAPIADIVESRNQPKSLSGIETLYNQDKECARASRNQPKSLSGIETPSRLAALQRRTAGINLNPYQGLKLQSLYFYYLKDSEAGINLNPYQGLKHFGNWRAIEPNYWRRNQPKSLSGIETMMVAFLGNAGGIAAGAPEST